MADEQNKSATEGVASRIDMEKTLSYMVSVMTSLIGGLATQGGSDKALTVEELPKWLEDNAAIARKIVDSFPQQQEATPEKPPDPISEDQWKLVTAKKSGKILGILPENDIAERWFSDETEHEIVSKKAISSYDAAVERCRERVKSIIKDCERKNQKFRDHEFPLDSQVICLRSLVPDPDGDPFVPPPQSVSRTRDIFTSPSLFVNGARADDVKQGKGGDCWFLAGVAALTNLKEGLNHNYVQVDGDEKVGVYGFVFHRDGEWIYEIVDDFLYCKNPVQGQLTKANGTDTAQPNYYGTSFEWKLLRNMNEEKYRKTFMNGSDALYFSKSRDENETWLPLLEKAYAKAHGDFQSIEGGFTGEAIEDLTGGITTEIKTEDILDLDRLWLELKHCNNEFIFSCWTPDWPDGNSASQGLYSGHAYSLMKAEEVEVEGVPQKLVLVRNPWGRSEWTGPYSDGSKEWTVELMQKLNHRFGDDGVFWMSYQDLLRNFQLFDRTRLIGPEWSYAQCWTNVSIPRQFRFHETKFTFTLDKDDRTVISLSQLDDRYIRGLEGCYSFILEFLLEKDGEGEILARSSTSYNTRRSVNAELDLTAGNYSLRLKIKADKDTWREPVKDAAQKYLKENTTKFIQIVKKYNLAFMKSGLGDEERITKSLNEQSQSTTTQVENQKPQLTPVDSDAEATLSPSTRGMENPKEVKDEINILSTDEPVENPTTNRPEAQTEEATSEKKDPKDDWDAIATVGLRLLTREAKVTLSVVESQKPAGSGVIVSRQSFPVGNVPPILGSAVEVGNQSEPPAESNKGIQKSETEKESKTEQTVADGTKGEIKETKDGRRESDVSGLKKQEVSESNSVNQTNLEQPTPLIDRPRPINGDQDLPQSEIPKRFQVRF